MEKTHFLRKNSKIDPRPTQTLSLGYSKKGRLPMLMLPLQQPEKPFRVGVTPHGRNALPSFAKRQPSWMNASSGWALWKAWKWARTAWKALGMSLKRLTSSAMPAIAWKPTTDLSPKWEPIHLLGT